MTVSGLLGRRPEPEAPKFRGLGFSLQGSWVVGFVGFCLDRNEQSDLATRSQWSRQNPGSTDGGILGPSTPEPGG